MQQVELGGGEVNLLLAKEHLMGVGIQAQIIHPQNSSIFLLQRAGTAQDGSDTGDHLIQRERLTHVVVTAC